MATRRKGREEKVVYRGKEHTVQRSPYKKSTTVVLRPVGGGTGFRLQRIAGGGGSPRISYSEELRPGVFLRAKQVTDPGLLHLFKRLSGALPTQPRPPPKRTKEAPARRLGLDITHSRDCQYNGKRVTAVWSKKKPGTLRLVSGGVPVATIFKTGEKRMYLGGELSNVPRKLMVCFGRAMRHANHRELNLFNRTVPGEHRFSLEDFKAQHRKPRK